MSHNDEIGRRITVDKIESAKRQLKTAVTLWFQDGDPIAIHTLAAAAYEVLHAIHKRCGHTGLLYDSDLIEDEHRKKWINDVKASANFFKHADRDPDAEFSFLVFTNELYFINCL